MNFKNFFCDRAQDALKPKTSGLPWKPAPTLQSVFNHVAGHFLSANHRTSMLRGLRDSKSLIGSLIPDEQYDPNLEGLPLTDHRLLLAMYDWAQGAASEDSINWNFFLIDVSCVKTAQDLINIANKFQLNHSVIQHELLNRALIQR